MEDYEEEEEIDMDIYEENPDQPIHHAALRGDLAEVQRLVTEGPSLVELRGLSGRTPLLRAAGSGHAAVVEWLLDYGGADIEAFDATEKNALYFSSWGGHLEVVSILLNRGADVNKGDIDDYSPLMRATAFGNVGVVELLLSQKGIDPNVQNRSGETALWLASEWGRANMISILLAAGADPRIGDNHGRTPLDKARSGSYDRLGGHGCIRLLEDALAEPERARLLHRARAINDAHYTKKKIARETKGSTMGERMRKMIAAAPAYLKRRVGDGRMLPQVDILRRESRSRRSRNAEKEEEKLAAAVERMVMDGHVPGEVFIELMEMMLPKWDDERRRR